MNKSDLSIAYIIRFIIFAAIIGKLLLYKDLYLDFYILFLLIFLLNAQVRIILLKNKWFLLSLFIDIGLLYYMYSQFDGFAYLLFYISIYDGLNFLEEEAYFVGAIGFGLLVYLLRRTSSEIIFLNIIIFFFLFVFAYHIKKLRKEVNEVEFLYDENRKYSYQLEDAKNRLEDYSKKIEQVSQLEERNRISRELHDTLGHKLTGILMQIEATIRILQVDRNKGEEMLQSVRDNMSQCVDVLRETVQNMRPKQYSNRVLAIQEMINDFIRDTGVNIDFKVLGSPVKLYPSVALTLYKNTQEAITNAVRHGKAKQIEVTLEYSEKDVVLSVRDHGIGCEEITQGMGMNGMEERVALLGGQLQLSTEKGFEVKTIIPIRY